MARLVASNREGTLPGWPSGAVGRTQREVALTGWDGSREATTSGVWSVTASLREQGRACARAALSGGLEGHQVQWSVVAPEGRPDTDR